jgi:hypothetical protein
MGLRREGNPHKLSVDFKYLHSGIQLPSHILELSTITVMAS